MLQLRWIKQAVQILISRLQSFKSFKVELKFSNRFRSTRSPVIGGQRTREGNVRRHRSAGLNAGALSNMNSTLYGAPGPKRGAFLSGDSITYPFLFKKKPSRGNFFVILNSRPS